MIRPYNHSNLLIINKLAERVGFESVIKRSFKDIQSTDCIQSLLKYVVRRVK